MRKAFGLFIVGTLLAHASLLYASNTDMAVDLFAVDQDGNTLSGDFHVTYCLSSSASERQCVLESEQDAFFEEGFYQGLIGLESLNPEQIPESAFLWIDIGEEELSPLEIGASLWSISSRLADRALQADVADVALTLASGGLGSGLVNAGGIITIDTASVPQLGSSNQWSNQQLFSNAPADTDPSHATVRINPTADPDSVLLAVQNNGASQMTVDAEGDVAIAGDLTASGLGRFTNLIVDGSSADALVLDAFGTGAGQTAEMRFYELDSAPGTNGVNYVGFKAPDAITANQVWTFPDADGDNGQILATDGVGGLFWVSVGGTGTITGVTAGSGLTGGGLSGTVTVAIDTNAVTSAMIADGTIAAVDIANGTITNTQINAAAAIADSKLATISTAGKVADTALSANVSLLGSSIDSSEITDGTITSTDISGSAGITDAQVSNTLTSSLFVGSGSSTNAVDLGTAEVAGILTVSKGGTGADLSATGGANQFVRQSSSGGALTVSALADADVPNNITIDLASAATALAANGTNCGAGQYPLGVDASGNAEGCTAPTTGTVTSVGSGTGLTGGPITGTGSLSIDQSFSPTWTGLQTFSHQAVFTRDPTDTTAPNASVLINPATSAANEKFFAIEDNGSGVFSVDKEGDVSAHDMNASGTITGTLSGNASTATALAANGTNCSAGQYPLGVDASGSVEGCTTATTGTVTSVSGSAPIISSGGNTPTLSISDATTAAKGAASFSASNFSVSSGAVSIKSGGVTTTEIADGTIVDADVSSSAAITSTKVSLADGTILVGNGSSQAAAVSMSGDVTIDNAGATTIGTGKVTSGKILDATITTTDISNSAGITDAQVNGDLTISGGTVNNTPVGATTRSTGAFTSLTVGSGSTGNSISRILTGSAALNFASTGALPGCSADLTIAVTNAALGNPVFLGVPNGSVGTASQFTAWVSAADTVAVRHCSTTVLVDPASGTFNVVVFQ